MKNKEFNQIIKEIINYKLHSLTEIIMYCIVCGIEYDEKYTSTFIELLNDEKCSEHSANKYDTYITNCTKNLYGANDNDILVDHNTTKDITSNKDADIEKQLLLDHFVDSDKSAKKLYKTLNDIIDRKFQLTRKVSKAYILYKEKNKPVLAVTASKNKLRVYFYADELNDTNGYLIDTSSVKRLYTGNYSMYIENENDVNHCITFVTAILIKLKTGQLIDSINNNIQCADNTEDTLEKSN